MTWKDNPAGWVSVTLLPAYLKMGMDENGNRPVTIAFAPELYEEMRGLIVNCRHNTKGPDGKPLSDANKLFAMDVVCDESLGDGDWEIRWVA